MEKLLTAQALADALGVSRQTILRWDPPSVEVGGRRRYRASDIERWLEQGTDAPAEPPSVPATGTGVPETGN